jgi:hypothetical protein
MELSNQLPGSHPLTAPVHPPERVTGPPELHHSEGRYPIDSRTTRHEGYAKSINARRGIEKVFGWIKQWGGLCQFKLRGTEKVGAVFGLHVIAYNLIRLGNLLNPAVAAA